MIYYKLSVVIYYTPLWGEMAGQGGFTSDVPSWDGNPSSYDAFETACKWYAMTLKDNERKGAAARIWSKLQGPARSVVKHLQPEEFFHDGGLDKLLSILRGSPLQTLPIPDTFSKLERWSNLRRREQETVAELLVREDDMFRELMQSLARSRSKAGQALKQGASAPATPKAAQDDEDEFGDLPDFRASPTSKPRSPEKHEDPSQREPSVAAGAVDDYFSNELRGYRLLKSVGISHAERQQVLTLTGNRVNFEEVRQALRGLYDSGSEHHHRGQRGALPGPAG